MVPPIMHLLLINTKFDKPLSIIADGSAIMLPHSILSPAIIISNFSIQISIDQ